MNSKSFPENIRIDRCKSIIAINILVIELQFFDVRF